MLFTKKDASCIAVSLLLIGCGGGGSQNPSKPSSVAGKGMPLTPTPVTTTPAVTTPVTPTPLTTIPAVTTPVTTPVVTTIPVESTPRMSFDTENLTGIKQAHAKGYTGQGVTVGIIDSDFAAWPDQMGDRIKTRFYENGGKGNGSTHGTRVAEVLGGSVAPGVSMLGAAGGPAGEPNRARISTAMLDDFLENDVRIVNLSLASGDIRKANEEDRERVRMFRDYVRQGMLFVWATGNDEQLNPGIHPGLPALDKSLEQGWLAVTAVNAEGPEKGRISSYANRCGDAAKWCLAAPGDFNSVTGKYRQGGTSFAAPAVAGAAALVQQAYPWMTGSLLRQTLLSTATDIGDPEIYGWGLLNVGKAVNGPALFDEELALKKNVTVDFDDASSVFRNDIAGNAGLIKEGTGTLTLAGQNTYAGDSSIKNGVLNITGSVRSNVAIGPSGALRADGGRVGGNVSNPAGTLDVAGKGLRIGGNYSSQKYAVLEKQMHAPLVIDGKATLDGSLVVTPPQDQKSFGYITSQGSKDRVLTAAQGITGAFKPEVGFKVIDSETQTTSDLPLLHGSLMYGEHAVDLTVRRKNLEQLAAQAFHGDATRSNAAENIEQVMRSADQLVAAGNTSGNESFLESTAALQRTSSLAAAADVLDSLSGQIHGSAQALTFQQSQAVNRDLSNRLAQLGDGKQGSAAATGFWASGMGSAGKLAQDGYASADTSLWGGQFGVDTRLNEQAIVGAALAYSDSKASFDRFGGQSKSQNIGVSLYGRHAFAAGGKQAYVSGRAGMATVDSRVSRTALLGSETDKLTARHTDSVLSTYVESGFEQPLSEEASMTPFAGLSYDRVKRGGFSESGGPFGLRADSQSYQQTASLLGVRAKSELNWFAGKSNLQMYAAWQRAFGSGKLDFSAAYNGAARVDVLVRGIGLARNTGWLGIGIATDVSRRWGWYANYDAQFGQAGILNNVMSTGVRVYLD
ncbi:autotransporter-associated beta strand protein [Collimonas sp. PA-H2]|uniref:autotransporter serine protease n=1 Tax=Collimonas sp. PA-H2 TaxID=1881062 RepID=UPI000BF3F826|nr:autotransporter serine protease [Collimonas sp. PA-H2]PFH11726.1 autotransporter-associated beta strand protein [Collimonas sp. PA-H2]